MIAGLDVGGSKTLGVVLDPGGAVRATVRVPTAGDGGDALLASTVRALADLATAVGLAPSELEAVGIGIPGVVNTDDGTVRHAVNLGVNGDPLALAAHLTETAGVSAVVENDVNAATAGAAAMLGDVTDLALLSIGTGVAAGLVLGGTLRRGHRGAAGEIGHVSLDPAGPPCVCGQRGCLEAVVSGPAIARRWPVDGATGAATALVAAAERSDPRAVQVLDEVAGYLAAAVVLLALTVDPDVILLGGGVAEAGSPLLAAVRSALGRRVGPVPLLGPLDLPRRVRLVPDTVPVGAVGAARLARERLSHATA
jgi:predicted NBD/HSP70 family sugar kinase